MLHQSELHGSSVVALLEDGNIAGAWSGRQALCTRVPEAETSTHLESPVRLVPWSSRKACSTSQSFKVALLQNTLQMPGRGKTSPLHPSAEGRDEHAPRVPCPPRTVKQPPQSLLHQSELHGGSVAGHIAGAWSGGQALCTRVQEAATSTHLESFVNFMCM